MKEIAVRLSDLPAMHPRLVWEEIAAAAHVVLAKKGKSPPFLFDFEVQSVPGFDLGDLRLLIEPGDTPKSLQHQLRRTIEPLRLVELAAIAVAGLGLHFAGGHEIRDVALRGSGADYLVGDELHPCEISGRSNRKDFGTAWKTRIQRMKSLSPRGFFVCVAEFQTPMGRLAFLEQ